MSDDKKREEADLSGGDLRKMGEMTEAELGLLMRSYAVALEKVAEVLMVEKPNFVLLVFNHPSRTQYVANCGRESVVEAMKEAVAKFEGGQVDERVKFPSGLPPLEQFMKGGNQSASKCSWWDRNKRKKD